MICPPSSQQLSSGFIRLKVKMKCPNCSEKLDVTFLRILERRNGGRYNCPHCGAQLEGSFIAPFLALLLPGLIKLFLFIIFQTEFGYLVYGLLVVVSYLLFSWLVPFKVIQGSGFTHPKQLRSYQSPIPLLIIGFIVVLYFMFKG